LSEHSPVEDAIEEVYSAFSDAPKPRGLDGCQHCIDVLDVSALLSCDLRDVPAEPLRVYAYKAMLTVGSSADFLYFFPRILQLAVTDTQLLFDVEVIGDRVNRAGLTDWPRNRIDSLVAVLRAVIQDRVAAGDIMEFDSWICAIALMGLDVMPYLREIESSRAGILEYFMNNAEGLPQGRLANAFWELPDARQDAVIAWFYSKKIRDVVHDEYGYVFPDGEPIEK
jgi:hypothetical protein